MWTVHFKYIFFSLFRVNLIQKLKGIRVKGKGHGELHTLNFSHSFNCVLEKVIDQFLYFLLFGCTDNTKQNHQLLFCWISDKVAGQGVFAALRILKP